MRASWTQGKAGDPLEGGWKIRRSVLLIERENGVWVAQGDGLDVVAQGRSMTEVVERFQKQEAAERMLATITGPEPLDDVGE